MCHDESVTRRAWLSAAGATGLALASVPGLTLAQQSQKKPGGSAKPQATIHVHPQLLKANDRVNLGPAGSKEHTIKSPTLLIWVDLMPGARFAHSTQLVLISADGAKVQDADWWPSLNGMDLFRDGKSTNVSVPIELADS